MDRLTVKRRAELLEEWKTEVEAWFVTHQRKDGYLKLFENSFLRSMAQGWALGKGLFPPQAIEFGELAIKNAPAQLLQ